LFSVLALRGKPLALYLTVGRAETSRCGNRIELPCIDVPMIAFIDDSMAVLLALTIQYMSRRCSTSGGWHDIHSNPSYWFRRMGVSPFSAAAGYVSSTGRALRWLAAQLQ
jgi:hypothetical protein